MKPLSVLLAVMCGMGFAQRVAPVPNDSPQILRWKKFAATNDLWWEVSIGMSEEDYCLTIKGSPEFPDIIHTECEPSLKRAVDQSIAYYRRGAFKWSVCNDAKCDKPGAR